MLDIPSEVEHLFRTDGIKKWFNVHFLNSTYADITDSEIVDESVSLTESISSRDEIKFGINERSVLEFDTNRLDEMKNLMIEGELWVDVSSIAQPSSKTYVFFDTDNNEKYNPKSPAASLVHPLMSISYIAPIRSSYSTIPFYAYDWAYNNDNGDIFKVVSNESVVWIGNINESIKELDDTYSLFSYLKYGYIYIKLDKVKNNHNEMVDVIIPSDQTKEYGCYILINGTSIDGSPVNMEYNRTISIKTLIDDYDLIFNKTTYAVWYNKKTNYVYTVKYTLTSTELDVELRYKSDLNEANKEYAWPKLYTIFDYPEGSVKDRYINEVYYPISYGKFRIEEEKLSQDRKTKHITAYTNKLVNEELSAFEIAKINYATKLKRPYIPNRLCFALASAGYGFDTYFDLDDPLSVNYYKEYESDVLASDICTSDKLKYRCYDDGILDRTDEIWNDMDGIYVNEWYDHDESSGSLLFPLEYKVPIAYEESIPTGTTYKAKSVCISEIEASINYKGYIWNFQGTASEHQNILPRTMIENKNSLIRCEYDSTQLMYELKKYLDIEKFDSESEALSDTMVSKIYDALFDETGIVPETDYTRTSHFNNIKKIISRMIKKRLTDGFANSDTEKSLHATFSKGAPIRVYVNNSVSGNLSFVKNFYYYGDTNLYCFINNASNATGTGTIADTSSSSKNVKICQLHIPNKATIEITKIKGFVFNPNVDKGPSYPYTDPRRTPFEIDLYASSESDKAIKNINTYAESKLIWGLFTQANDIETYKFDYKKEYKDLKSEINLTDMINGVFEIYGRLGYYSRANKRPLSFYIKDRTDVLYPNEILYPSGYDNPRDDGKYYTPLYTKGTHYTILRNEYTTIDYEETRMPIVGIKTMYVKTEKNQDNENTDYTYYKYILYYGHSARSVSYREDDESEESKLERTGIYDFTNNFYLSKEPITATKDPNSELSMHVISRIYGISYTKLSLDSIGLPFLEPGDVITIAVGDEKFVKTIILRRTLKGVKRLTDSIESQ